MRILWLSPWFPHPPTNGSKLRISSLLGQLATRHEVDLISFLDEPDLDPAPQELTDICRSVEVIAKPAFDPSSWRARLGFMSLRPRAVGASYSAPMADLIERRVTGGGYGLVVASEWRMAAYAPLLDGVPSLFEDPEMGAMHDRANRPAPLPRRIRNQLGWRKRQRYLRSTMDHFDAVSVVSDAEARLLIEAAGDDKPVVVVPNGIDVASYASVDVPLRPNTLVFTGSYGYFPNHEAMQWFVGDIFPDVRAAVPDARLEITGNTAGKVLPEHDGVAHLGFVDDVKATVGGAAVALAPLLTGGGTRLKILEAFALRTPVVSTSKGAEGLGATDGTHLLVADTVEAFAAAVVRILTEPGLGDRLSTEAAAFVGERYDWSAMGPRLLDLVDQMTG